MITLEGRSGRFVKQMLLVCQRWAYMQVVALAPRLLCASNVFSLSG